MMWQWLLLAFYFVAWTCALLWAVSHIERTLQRNRRFANLVFGLIIGISFFAAYSMAFHPVDLFATCFDRQGAYDCE